jgi:hypothetical protein
MTTDALHRHNEEARRWCGEDGDSQLWCTAAPDLAHQDPPPSAVQRGWRAAQESASALQGELGPCRSEEGAALPPRGFIRQERIELPAFLANRFGCADQRSRQVESTG